MPSIHNARARTSLAVSLASALLLALLVSGCGSDNDSQDAVVGKGPYRHNAADVTFARDMIPHHAQAVAMANFTIGRKVDPQIVALAERIRAIQTPQTSKLSSWLQDWGKDVPRTMIDHGGHAMGDTSMPGAMTKAELQALEHANGARFERLWLVSMIAHHKGAVTMAKTEQARGANPAAVRLAERIVQGQQSEISRIDKLLRDPG